MISHLSVQSHLLRPSFGALRRGLIAALAALAFFTGFEVSDLRARSGIQPSVETVNRTLKGDRLSSMPAFDPGPAQQHHEINPPRESSKLLIGCDPLVSPLVSRQLSRIASRCIS